MRELSPDVEAGGKIKCLSIRIHSKTSKEECLQTKGDVREPMGRRRRTTGWERAELGLGHSCALQQHCHLLGGLCLGQGYRSLQVFSLWLDPNSQKSMDKGSASHLAAPTVVMMSPLCFRQK